MHTFAAAWNTNYVKISNISVKCLICQVLSFF